MSGTATLSDYFVTGFSSNNTCSYAISLAAERRGLRVEWLGIPFFKHLQVPLNQANQLGNLYRLSDGRRRLIFNRTLALSVSEQTRKTLADKFSAAAALASYNIATTKPQLYDLDDPKSYQALHSKASYPLVLKPVKGSMGKGVFANIETPAELTSVLQKLSGKVVCERHISGKEYRIYALGGQPVAAVRRHPPMITGDGQRTVEQLIEQENTARGKRKLPKIKFEDATLLRLKKSRLTYQSVPEAGEQIILSDKLGRSSGGMIERVPLNSLPGCGQFCEAVYSAFPDLEVFAADVIDTGKELVVIEINSRPQSSSLLKPDLGEPFDFADAFVCYFFSQPKRLHNTAPISVRAIKDDLKSGAVRASFSGRALADYAPVIAEPDTELLHNQGNIHQLILQRAAWRQGCLVNCFTNKSGYKRWSVTSANRTLRFRQNMPAVTSLKTREITNDKFATKRKLEQAGIYTPRGEAFASNDIDAITTWYRALPTGTKVVVKPIDGAGGKGVTSNIQSYDELLMALDYARASQVVIEEHIEGDDFRLICSGGRFLAAIHRLPASVTGDGKHTIEQLIAIKNKARKANPYLKKCVIRYDEAMAYRLQKSGYTLATVLADNEHCFLNDIANVSAGGDSVDVTDKVHDDYRALAERAQLAFTDLAYCGVDILATDISSPIDPKKTAVIEVNANCDVALHHFPSVGKPRNVAGEIMADLLPAGNTERQARYYRVRGKVTGVGYRRWAAKICAALGLEAGIRNVGSEVEISARGTQVALDELQRLLIQGSNKSVPTEVSCRPLNIFNARGGVRILDK